MRLAGTFHGMPIFACGALLFLHDGDRWAMVYTLGLRVSYARAT